MNKNKLDRIVKRFILGEATEQPDIFSYIQAINEIVSKFSPHSLREHRQLQIIGEHLREIRRHARKLNEQVKMLEERVSILEEKKKK